MNYTFLVVSQNTEIPKQRIKQRMSLKNMKQQAGTTNSLNIDLEHSLCKLNECKYSLEQEYKCLDFIIFLLILHYVVLTLDLKVLFFVASILS